MPSSASILHAHSPGLQTQGSGPPRFRVCLPSSINSVKNISQPGKAAHTFKSNTLRQRQGQEDLFEFEANLVNTGVPGQPGLYIKTCLQIKDERKKGKRERGREGRTEGRGTGRILANVPSDQPQLDNSSSMRLFPDDSRLYQQTVKTAHHTLQSILVLKAENILKKYVLSKKGKFIDC